MEQRSAGKFGLEDADEQGLARRETGDQRDSQQRETGEYEKRVGSRDATAKASHRTGPNLALHGCDDAAHEQEQQGLADSVAQEMGERRGVGSAAESDKDQTHLTDRRVGQEQTKIVGPPSEEPADPSTGEAQPRHQGGGLGNRCEDEIEATHEIGGDP